MKTKQAQGKGRSLDVWASSPLAKAHAVTIGGVAIAIAAVVAVVSIFPACVAITLCPRRAGCRAVGWVGRVGRVGRVRRTSTTRQWLRRSRVGSCIRQPHGCHRTNATLNTTENHSERRYSAQHFGRASGCRTRHVWGAERNDQRGPQNNPSEYTCKRSCELA